jgi:ribosomal protein S18 acetylase RimI-like enzyme
MPESVATLGRYVDRLQRANAEDLAFYPRDTLDDAIASGHVLFGHENGSPAGYLWFGAVRPMRDVVIYQACIDYELRRRHIGHAMVRELLTIARVACASGMRLKCASSADSNAFWRSIGFYCTRVTGGGVKRGRDVNHYRTDIHATLVTATPVQPSDRPIDMRAYQAMKRDGVPMPSRFSRSHYGGVSNRLILPASADGQTRAAQASQLLMIGVTE